MSKHFPTLFCLFVLTQPCLSQVFNKDSLLYQYNTQKDDSNKVKTLLLLGQMARPVSTDSSRSYYVRAGQLARKLNDNRGLFKYLAHYSDLLASLGSADSALALSEASLPVAEALKDSLFIGMSHVNIGIGNREIGSYEKAIEHLLKGIPIVERLGDKSLPPQLNDALQLLYRYKKQFDKAIEVGRLALAQSRALNDSAELSNCLINLGLDYIEKNDLRPGVALLEEALTIGRRSNDPRIIAYALQNLGGVAMKQRDYKKTREYAEEALSIHRQRQAPDGEALAMRTIGVCDLQEGNFARAKELVEKAYAIDKANGAKESMSIDLRTLSILNYATNNREKGLDLDYQAQDIFEDMVRETLSKQSSDLEKKYETEKKITRIKELEDEKEIQTLRLRQKDIVNYIVIGGALIFLVVSLLIYRNHRQKQVLQQQRINDLEREKQLAATEAVLKGEEQERTRLAKDLHDGLGGMLSGLKYSFSNMKGNLVMTPANQDAFERSMDMLDSSIKEMRRVAHNLMPEALVKFGLDTALKDFCNDINQSGVIRLRYQSIGLEGIVIDNNTAITIYRIVQELVNNTLKHAAAATALVQVTKDGDDLTITVEDDGKGFDTSLLQKVKGIGWDNIRSRVEYLKGKLDVQSAPGKGTSVLVQLTAPAAPPA